MVMRLCRVGLLRRLEVQEPADREASGLWRVGARRGPGAAGHSVRFGPHPRWAVGYSVGAGAARPPSLPGGTTARGTYGGRVVARGGWSGQARRRRQWFGGGRATPASGCILETDDGGSRVPRVARGAEPAARDCPGRTRAGRRGQLRGPSSSRGARVSRSFRLPISFFVSGWCVEDANLAKRAKKSVFGEARA